MPLPLREPFFLQGRTSVVQRAVIMSVVLGVLSGIAGWAVAVVILVTLEIFSSEILAHILCAAWTVAILGILYGPSNYYNCRSPLWTLAAAPLSYGLMFLFLEVADGSNSVASAWMAIVFCSFSAVSGLLLVRPRRSHVLAYLVAVTAAIAPRLISHLINHAEWPVSFGITDEIAFVLSFAAWFTSWLAALSIPWGIPFWWPPEKDVGAASAGPAP